MTTGFDTQPTTFGDILKAAPKPQALGSKINPPQETTEDRPPEPRTFGNRAIL